MTDEEVTGAAVKWLSTMTSILFIQGDQSGDQPPYPYGVCKLVSTDKVRDHGQDVSYEDVVDDIVARPLIEVEWFFSLNVYGPGASAVLRRVRSAVEIEDQVGRILRDVIIHDVSQIRNLTEYIGEKMETRAQMDFIVRGVTDDGFLVDAIETISVEFERT